MKKMISYVSIVIFIKLIILISCYQTNELNKSNLIKNSNSVEFTREEIKLGASKYISNQIKLKIIEDNDKVLDLTGEINLQTDIITNFPLNSSFELLISQGYSNDNEYISIRTSTGIEINSILDNFSNISQNGISYFSENFSPINSKYEFESFIEPFSNTFHFMSTPLLDRTNYIINTDPNNIFYYMNEVVDKPCVEILDGIKSIFPKFGWPEFQEQIDYDKISSSTFKNILFKVNKSSVKSENENENTIFELNIRILYKIDENKNYYNNEIILNSNRILKGKRFDFEPYTLKHVIEIDSDFLFNKNTNTSNSLLNKLQIIELLPMQFEFYYSSLNLEVNLIKVNTNLESNYRNSEIHYYNPNGINTSFIKSKNRSSQTLVVSKFNYENIDYIGEVIFKKQMEEQNSNIAYTYESKYSNLVYLNLNLDNVINVLHLEEYTNKEKDSKYKVQLIFSIDLKKVLHNFESYENEMEFGFKVPCGLILLNKAANSYQDSYASIFNSKGIKLISTNQIYFNIPLLDNTVPFTIIAFTWVVFGFILIQMLNKYLNSEGGLITNSLSAIKARLVDRCGKLNLIISLLCCKSKKTEKSKDLTNLNRVENNNVETFNLTDNGEIVDESNKKNQ